jgi:hypothetical protein
LDIRAVVVLKHPVDRVWRVMRDELERIVTSREGIRELEVVRREAEAAGGVRVVSIWQAEVSVPALAAPYVDPEMFRWRDDARWDETRRECRWRIATAHHAERIDCAGTTCYAPAMGGRGTRITMRGTFRWDLGGVLDLPPGMAAGVHRGIESFVGGLISRNFRRIAEAARRHLDDGAPK